MTKRFPGTDWVGWSPAAMAILGATVAVMALLALPAEYAAARWSGQSSVTQTAQILAGTTPRPLTWVGQSAVLRSCDEIMRDDMALQAPAAQAQIRSTCLSVAYDSLAQSPTGSLAYQVIARAEATAGRQIDNILIQAQTHGAGVGWLAQRRFSLVPLAYPTLGGRAKARVQSDMRLLMWTQAGLPFVAQQFVAHPDLRPMITDMAAELPNSVRRRFLAAVRTAQRE